MLIKKHIDYDIIDENNILTTAIKYEWLPFEYIYIFYALKNTNLRSGSQCYQTARGGPWHKKGENPWLQRERETKATSQQPQPDLTLVVQLEGPQAIVLEGPEVDGDGVGGASDHLPLYQEGVVGQNGQGRAIHPTDGKQLPLGQVHTLHLETGRGRQNLSHVWDRASVSPLI